MRQLMETTREDIKDVPSWNGWLEVKMQISFNTSILYNNELGAKCDQAVLNNV